MSDHTCLFCDHVFTGRRRKFCFDCLPEYNAAHPKVYHARYQDLYRACGLMPGVPGPFSRLGPEFKPPKPPREPKPPRFCMCGAATPSSKAAWCSDKCREANRRRNQRQIRRDGGEYGTPRLEPEVVSERQKNNLASATARRVLRMWPIGECNLCNGPLQPWWIMYPSESPAPHCYVCDQELHKERYDKRNSVVKCLTCGEQFERTGSKRNFCSEDCKKLGRHDRNRRDRAKRLGASTGEPYSMRDVIEQSGGLCHLCGEPVDTELSGSDPDGPTIDHLTPLSLGGIDCRTNVALAHWLCNVKRGNKPLEVATWTTSVKN